MKQVLLLHPIFNGNSINVFKMLHIVGNHYQTFGFSSTANVEIKVLYFLPCIPQSYSFLGKLMNCFCKRNDGYFAQELLNLLKILFWPITLIRTYYQFCYDYIIYKATRLSHSIKPMGNIPVSAKERNAYAGVKHVSLHSSVSKLFAVLMLRISSTISSAERLSFHAPQNLSAQPEPVTSSVSFVSSSSFTIELLSNEISSNLSLLLKFFSNPQYGTEVGDVEILFIIPVICNLQCKIRNKF